jgi:broad-specificity NMP kinase
MKLVFLYGRPGVGKLTIARRLCERSGLRLFHNHLAVERGFASSKPAGPLDYAMPIEPALRIDTTMLDPAEAAKRIIEGLSLRSI